MAESLGTAKLTLEVDDQQFRAGLQQAEGTAKGTGAAIKQDLTLAGLKLGDSQQFRAGLQEAEQQAAATGQAVAKRFTASGREILTAGNGLNYFIDASGRARQENGRFVTSAERAAAGIGAIGESARGAGVKLEGLGGGVGSITNAVRGLVPQLTALGTAAFVFDQIKKADEAGAAVRTLGVDSAELSKRLDLLSASLNGNFSKVELLKAAYDVASSGFASAADATNVLRGAAQAAAGGFTDLETASDGITTVLNAYGLASSEATSLADKFIQTQNDGKITVAQYGREIGGVASIAATANIGIDELNAAIAASTAKTGQVSQTFTGLRQVISSILKPSKEASDLASSLGIQYNLAGLKAKGFAGLLTEIAQKTGGSADKIAILTGSVEAQAAIQPLLNDQLASYNKALDNQKNSAGAASKASQENANTISGSIKQIGNEFSNLATSLDKTLAPVFKGFIRDLDNVLKKLVQVNTLNPKTVLDAQSKSFSAVESQTTPLQRTGFFGNDLTVNYGGKSFKGTATGIADEITRFILQQAIDKQLNDAGAKGTPASKQAKPVEPPPPYKLADYEALVEKSKEITNASREQLIAATELSGKQGTQLSIAQARLSVEKAIRGVDSAAVGLDAANTKKDPKEIKSASQALADSGNTLRTALITGADAARIALKDAAKSVEDAFKSLQSARQGAFDLLPGSSQTELRQAAENKINRQIQSGELDRFKVAAALGTNTFRNADPQRLFDVAGKAGAIDEANKALTKATQDQTLATIEQSKITAEFNKASATLVGVLVNAILYKQPSGPYLQ